MFLYVELWDPKPAWDNLAREQREEFLSRLLPNFKQMEDLQVELVGFTVCDEDIPLDSGCRYMAVWKMPNLGHVHMLEKAVANAGWDNYFNIRNARGRIVRAEDLIKDMVKA